VPLDPTVREWGDKGTPVVQAAPSSEVSKAFAAIADTVVERCEEAHADDEAGPVIDRSGGTGGKKRLPVTR
jgi:ATP-binding protein involved in chromosome partitioning